MLPLTPPHANIAQLAEALDGHRKAVQLEHPEITLTQMYNVLEKVRVATKTSPSPFVGEGAQRADEGVVDASSTASNPSSVAFRATFSRKGRRVS